eukprot:274723_1
MQPKEDEQKQNDLDNNNFPEDIRRIKWYQNPINWIRIVIALVLMSLLIFALCRPRWSINRLISFLEWIENNPWYGTLAFMITYIIATVCMITGSILCLGGGYIYSKIMGFWLGILYATFILTIACFIASIIAFIIGRFVLRNAFVYSIRNHPKFQLMDKAVELHGFMVVFLFRLSPLTVYWLFNYIAGTLSITFKAYCLGAIGMIPNVFIYVYIGGSMYNIYEISKMNLENSKSLLIVTIIGAVLLSIAIFYFIYIARKKLKEIEYEISEQSRSLTSISDDDFNSYDDL